MKLEKKISLRVEEQNFDFHMRQARLQKRSFNNYINNLLHETRKSAESTRKKRVLRTMEH